MKKSLLLQLNVFIVAIIIISLGLCTSFSIFYYSRIIKEKTYASLDDKKEYISAEINHFIDKYIVSLENLAYSHSVVSILKEKNLMLNQIGPLPECEDLQLYMSELQANHSDIKKVSFILTETNCEINKDSLTITNFNHDQLTNFNDKEVIMLSPYLDFNTTGLVMTIGIPIEDKKGEIKGIIAYDLALDFLDSYIQEVINDDITILIIDKKGDLIYGPDASFIGKKAEKFYELWDHKPSLYKTEIFLDELGWTIELYNNLTSMYDQILWSIIILLCLFIAIVVLALLCSRLTLKNTLSDIPHILEILNKVSQGQLDLQISIKSQNEIGKIAHKTNDMINNLKALIEMSTGVSEQIISISRQVNEQSKSSLDSAYTIENQLNEIVAGGQVQEEDAIKCFDAMNVIGNEIDSLHSKFETDRELYSSVQDFNIENRKILHVFQEDHKLNQCYFNKMESLVDQLGHRMKTIEDILNVIRHIANETNLVALNTTIEAARFGDSGHGFKVVAQEIQKLSTQCTKAAENISGIVSEIMILSNNTETTMEHLRKTSAQQEKNVQEIDSTFQEIDQIINNLTVNYEQSNQIIRGVTLQKNDVSKLMKHIMELSKNHAGTAIEVQAIMKQYNDLAKITHKSILTLEDETYTLDNHMHTFKI
ncbi:methyl-accepting chemotaxis protein [Vallitalea okinawensis]|uniref:methyl-accepting chemotaxis protein n=1 Tax=Vallitalea okinawensis TaxID=2078660 RepID=UPI000CFD82C4|nr:methyl-accepting chemotaxis protein [Vallitalea okinawensis]